MRTSILCVIIALGASSLRAQEGGPATRDTMQGDAQLLAAMQLASEGQGDSARAMVRRRMMATPANDPVFPEILYAAGVVAGNADSAMLYLRRVSIEYSRSAWADKALLRLAQLAFATGDLTAARRAAERLVEDYPASPVLADGAFWAGRTYFEQNDIDGGCRYLARAEEAATQNFELANRIRYYRQRCSVDLAPARDTTSADSTTLGRVTYTVQIAAVGSPTAADQMMRRLAAEGFQSHLVTEDGLYKVRVGRFGTRAEAEAILGSLRDAAGGSPFIVEER